MKRPWNNPIKSLNGKLMPVPRGLTLLGIKLYPVEDYRPSKVYDDIFNEKYLYQEGRCFEKFTRDMLE